MTKELWIQELLNDFKQDKDLGNCRYTKEFEEAIRRTFNRGVI